MKMMLLLRGQDEVFSMRLAEAKADIEAATVARMREEQDDLSAQHEASLFELSSRHGMELNAVREALTIEMEATLLT